MITKYYEADSGMREKISNHPLKENFISVTATCHNKWNSGGFINGQQYTIFVKPVYDTMEILVFHEPPGTPDQIYPTQYTSIIDFLHDWHDIKPVLNT